MEQWGQTNLTAEAGTAISLGVTGISPDPTTTPTSQNNETTGMSPNDGYSKYVLTRNKPPALLNLILSIGNDGVQQVMQTASQNIASD